LAVTTETDLGVATPVTVADALLPADDEEPPPHAVSWNASARAASVVRTTLIESLLVF
jgi:hypothetical protein